MNTTLRQLEVFAAVARYGGVTRAAEELHLTQSAVSMALGALERQLGDPLFDRKGRRLLLNERGRALLPRAQEVLARVEEIEELFGQETGRLVGRLRIGASSTIGNYLIPHLLGDFIANYPDVRISLEVGNTEQIIDELQRFSIDLGFIEGFCSDPAIEAHPWRRDELIVFAAPDHPLARAAAVTLDDLAGAAWILRERGSGTREVFEAAIRGTIPHLDVLLELGHTEAIKQAVETGLGISCLSRLAVERSLQSGDLVHLETPFLDLERDFYLLLHREKFRTRVLDTFVDYCRAE